MAVGVAAGVDLGGRGGGGAPQQGGGAGAALVGSRPAATALAPPRRGAQPVVDQPALRHAHQTKPSLLFLLLPVPRHALQPAVANQAGADYSPPVQRRPVLARTRGAALCRVTRLEKKQTTTTAHPNEARWKF